MLLVDLTNALLRLRRFLRSRHDAIKTQRRLERLGLRNLLANLDRGNRLTDAVHFALGSPNGQAAGRVKNVHAVLRLAAMAVALELRTAPAASQKFQADLLKICFVLRRRIIESFVFHKPCISTEVQALPTFEFVLLEIAFPAKAVERAGGRRGGQGKNGGDLHGTSFDYENIHPPRSAKEIDRKLPGIPLENICCRSVLNPDPPYHPPCRCVRLRLEKCVSGGQTGADIAALDVALRHGFPRTFSRGHFHGGVFTVVVSRRWFHGG